MLTMATAIGIEIEMETIQASSRPTIAFLLFVSVILWRAADAR